MSTWYSKEPGDGVEAFQPTSQVQEILDTFFSASGLPKDMAYFQRYDRERSIATAYLSPAAHSVALAIEATPCEKPNREGLALTFGDQDGANRLFEE